MRSVKRQQTTDNGRQTPGRESLDPGQGSVVGSQWSRIRKDALRSALSALLLTIGVNLRLISLESIKQPLGCQADGISVQDRQIIGKDQNSHDQQENPCGHMNRPDITPKAL